LAQTAHHSPLRQAICLIGAHLLNLPQTQLRHSQPLLHPAENGTRRSFAQPVSRNKFNFVMVNDIVEL
jgi:hypothetical protein